MYNYIALGLLLLGVILMFSPDTLISSDTQNPILLKIYNHSQIVAILCFVFAYYYFKDKDNFFQPRTDKMLPSPQLTDSNISSDLTSLEM